MDRTLIRAAVSIVLLLFLAGVPVLLSRIARQEDAEQEASEKSVKETEEAADVMHEPRTFERSAIPQKVLERMRAAVQPVENRAAANAVQERTMGTPAAVRQWSPSATEEREMATPAAARRRRSSVVEEGPGDAAGDSRSTATGEDRGMAVLDIEVDGERLDQVAAHFGYALAAFYLSEGDPALLGLFEGDRLRYPSLEELQGFSGRGRSAERLPDRGRYREMAARQSGMESGKIRLLFLVPRKVDEQWLEWQKAVVGRHGYRFEEVAAVKARYGEHFELVACALVLKNGGVKSLEGGGL